MTPTSTSKDRQNIYYFQLGICMTFFPILKYFLVDIQLGDLSIIRTLARVSHEKQVRRDLHLENINWMNSFINILFGFVS